MNQDQFWAAYKLLEDNTQPEDEEVIDQISLPTVNGGVFRGRPETSNDQETVIIRDNNGRPQIVVLAHIVGITIYSLKGGR